MKMFVKVLFILSFLLVCIFAWLILTPWDRSHDPEYKDIVEKLYRTKMPFEIVGTELLDTSTVKEIFGSSDFDILPVGSLIYLRRVESIPFNGGSRYLLVIKSSGPQEGRKVFTTGIWLGDEIIISSTTRRASKGSVEEVPGGHY
jgi:hypothetical protein